MSKPRIRVSPKESRTVDGIVFASRAESNRYHELSLLQRAGEIHDLRIQVPYILQESFRHPVHGLQRAIKYIADFVYIEKNGMEIVEDSKGMRTEVYKLKKKLLLARFPMINFIETGMALRGMRNGDRIGRVRRR